MLKSIKNDRGIALLTVMVIMSVVVITGSLILKMSSMESRIIDNYGDNLRAFYVAEAGADLAIKKWDAYIAGLGVLIDANNNQVAWADVNAFLAQVESDRTVLQNVMKTAYGLDPASASVSIDYVSEWPGGPMNLSITGTPVILSLTVTGKYNNDTFEQKVQLWYYYDNLTGSYKGYDPASIGAHDPPPPGGGGGGTPQYHPPASSADWTVLTGGGGDQWNFDPTTGTITRTPESGHDFLYHDEIIRVPFSMDMNVSFYNLSKDSDKYEGSFAGVGWGYDPWGIPHYAVYLTIMDYGSGPRVSVGVFNELLPVAFGTFTQPMTESSRYRIQLTAESGNLSIIISNGTGQEINYTRATTLRDGRMLLIDGTNSHADPKFNFP